jgi:hypothetical protein
MKIFSQIVSIKDLNTNEVLSLLVDPFNMEPTSDTTNNATIQSVDMTLYTTDEIKSNLVGRVFSCQVSINSGSIVFGNYDYPAKCEICRYLNHYKIKITIKTPYPII